MPPNANPSPENRAAIRPYFGDDDGLQSLNNGRWHWGGLGPLNFPMIRFPCFGSLFYPSRRNPANCDNDGWNLSWCCWFYSKNAKNLRYFQGDDNSRFLNQEKENQVYQVLSGCCLVTSEWFEEMKHVFSLQMVATGKRVVLHHLVTPQNLR